MHYKYRLILYHYNVSASDVQEMHHSEKVVQLFLSDAFPLHHEQPHCYGFITLATEMLYITAKMMYNFLRANHM